MNGKHLAHKYSDLYKMMVPWILWAAVIITMYAISYVQVRVCGEGVGAFVCRCVRVWVSVWRGEWGVCGNQTVAYLTLG